MTQIVSVQVINSDTRQITLRPSFFSLFFIFIFNKAECAQCISQWWVDLSPVRNVFDLVETICVSLCLLPCVPVGPDRTVIVD